MTDNMAFIRFKQLLIMTYKETVCLTQTDTRLFSQTIDQNWVKELELNQDKSELLDAFSARYGRLQDTLGDKLLPSFLNILAEPIGSNIDNLNRIERLGLLSSVTDWLEARNIRNKMVHEYIDDADLLMMSINRAHELVKLLIETYNQINHYAKERFDDNDWPAIIQY